MARPEPESRPGGSVKGAAVLRLKGTSGESLLKCLCTPHLKQKIDPHRGQMTPLSGRHGARTLGSMQAGPFNSTTLSSYTE